MIKLTVNSTEYTFAALELCNQAVTYLIDNPDNKGLELMALADKVYSLNEARYLKDK